MTQAGDLLTSLSCDRTGCDCRASAKRGHGLTHCPAHDDQHPSLSVDERDGRVLWSCKAGCSQEAVTEALRERKLWGKDGPRALRTPRVVVKKVTWDILAADGTLQARHVRKELAGGGKRFEWLHPDGRPSRNGEIDTKDKLYGLELLAQHPDKPVVLAEGEKAADALRGAGVRVALATVCGASTTPAVVVLEHLRGRRVVLWPDADDAGRQHMDRIADRLSQTGAAVVIVEWPEAPEKGDAADFVVGHSREELQDLLRTARVWQPANGASAGPQLELRVILTNPRVWYLRLPGLNEIRLKTAELSRWPLIEQACLEQLIKMPTWQPRNGSDWTRVLTDLVAAADVQESPPELTNRGRVVELLKHFVGHSFDRPDALLKASAFYDVPKRIYVFRMTDFLRHMDRVGVKDLNDSLVWDVLKQLGGTDARKIVDGQRMRVACLHAAALEEPADDQADELDTEEEDAI